MQGYALPYDDARLIIQALGAQEERLKRPGGILEVKGNTARLLPVAERRRWLLGAQGEGERPQRPRRAQLELFEELEGDTSVTPVAGEPAVMTGQTTLDRLHQAMLLFGEGRTEALRRFLIDEGVGRDIRFWRLANALSRLYPMNSQEKRWVDGLLARKKVLGL